MAQIYRQLVEMYGLKVIPWKQIWVLCNAFDNGRTDIQDEQRPGRPSIFSTDGNVCRIEDMIKEDRCIKPSDPTCSRTLPCTVLSEMLSSLAISVSLMRLSSLIMPSMRQTSSSVEKVFGRPSGRAAGGNIEIIQWYSTAHV